MTATQTQTETVCRDCYKATCECTTREIHRGFTRRELADMFSALQDPNDWRNRIDRVITDGDYARARAAVEFYTATELVITHCPHPGMIRVQSIGYRAGPAGP